MRHNVTRSLGYMQDRFFSPEEGGGGGEQKPGDQNQQQQQQTDGNPADTSGANKVTQQQQAAKKFEYAEDRSTWIPKHRFDEVSAKTTKADAEIARLRGEIETEQKRVRAALGIETPKPEEQEAEALRAALTQLFPGLERLLDGKTLQQLESLTERAGAMEAAAGHHWQNHAENMLGDVEKEVQDLLGVETLTERQQRQIRRAYRDAADEAEALRQAQPGGDYSNDFLARHAKADKKLVAEFAKEFVGDWMDVAKRNVEARAVNRFRPVPKGGQSRPITSQKPKGDMNKDDDFAAALMDARKNEGGGFNG